MAIKQNTTLVFLLVSLIIFSQEKLKKDLDFDGIIDTIYFIPETSAIVCELSSHDFKKAKYMFMENWVGFLSIEDAKNGFKLNVNSMRAGSSYQFRYNKKNKKMRLIGMSRYELGNATHDGSGESSVNLLTNSYIGNWNYFDVEKDTLIKLPPIKKKMIFKKTYLEDFDGAIASTYGDQCSKLYHIARESYQTNNLFIIQGNYHFKDEIENCNIHLDVYYNYGNNYSYILQTPTHQYSDDFTIQLNEKKDGYYFTLENIPWSEYLGSLNEDGEPIDANPKTRIGISGVLYKNEMTIQNYGNATNYYVKLADCKAKYIHLKKQ